MKRLLIILSLSGILWPAHARAAAGPCVVQGRSHFRINVGTGGLFGGFAHSHLIEAQNIEGCASIDATDIRKSSIKLTFSAAAIKVLDPKESEKDRSQVQKTMETDVLKISQFPQITFESTALESAGPAGSMRVRGNLTITGKTQPVVIALTLTHLEDGTYRVVGKHSLKQTSYGIKPIQLAGGTVKVKDEIETDFEIILK